MALSNDRSLFSDRQIKYTGKTPLCYHLHSDLSKSNLELEKKQTRITVARSKQLAPNKHKETVRPYVPSPPQIYTS